MNTDYHDLTELIKTEQDLSSFFSKNHDYDSIVKYATYYEDTPVINALYINLPLNTWFNKNKIFNDFINIYKEEVFEATKYRWCMTIPEVRKLFTPDEKGKFVRLGFALREPTMSYHGTLDHDWEGEIHFSTLTVELQRIAGNRVKSFDGEHLQKKYLEWMHKEILPKTIEKDQYFFMFGALDIAISDLRQISEFKSLAELDLFTQKTASTEQIYQIYNDLKDCIQYLKEQLYFDTWPENFKNEFNRFSTDAPVSINKFIEKKELEEFAEKLIPIAEYSKLNKELSQHNTVVHKKVKM